MKRVALMAVVLAAAWPATDALAWGPTGHRLIGELAMARLPADVPGFLRGADVARDIGMLAQEPDRWRNSGDPHDSERDPGHFVHGLDDGTVMGGPKLASLPPTRKGYDTALRAAGSTQYDAGYLPYAIVDGWQQLREDFAYWRVDAAGEKFAKSADDRAWFARDRTLREMLTVRDLGVWAHFVGDASQPNHASVHYDAWGPGPNPENFPQTKGIHWRFEGTFVGANIMAGDIAPLIAGPRDCACAIEQRTAAYLVATQSFVLQLYRLDKAHAFDSAGTPDGKAFAVSRIAAATGELRDMIVAAWRESDGIKIGIPAVVVKDAEAGDPAAIKSIRGTD
jgi:hypothetical protein